VPFPLHRAFTRLALLMLLATALVAMTAVTAQAATYNVTTQEDETPADPADCVAGGAPAGCSLREAVQAANLTTAADTINLPAGEYVLDNENDDPTDGSADLDVESLNTISTAAGALTILGADARTTTIRSGGFDAGGSPVNSRIFDIEGGTTFDPGGGCQNFSGGSLELRSVRLSRGADTNEGGAIDVNDGGNNCAGVATNDFDGKLTLRTVALTNNSARDEGGAIFNGGETAIFDSLIANNSSIGDNRGGGIRNDDSLTLTNTTISGNTVPGGAPGGGISISSDSIEEGAAGGESFGRTDATNVTIAYNDSSNNGGGVAADGFNSNDNVPQFFARNTIIAGNEAADTGDSCFGAGSFVSLGNNLEDGDTCGFTGPSDLSSTDAGLLPRANNGGSTDTIGLAAGSPARDAGTNDGCPATDQRGAARPQGARCDIGAFEATPVAAAPPTAAAGTTTTTTNTIGVPVLVAFPRLLPERVTARVTKTRTGSGLRLRTRGRVTPPRGLTPGEACQFGIVTVSVKSGTRTVSTRLAQLEEDCTFASSVVFRVRSRLGNRVLSVSARFIGNNRMLRRSAPRVNAGRP
jgi:CSLREA domain-containing protein